MKSTTFTLALLAATVGFSQPSASLIPPRPQPSPPQVAPKPTRENSRVLPLTETIPDWQARWELARALSYLKRYDESLAEYRRVLQERPQDSAVRQDYGQVLLWAGKVAEAFEALNAVPPAELSPAARLALADTLIARGDFSRAETIYRNQIAADKNDQVSRLKLAEILSWTKRFDESLALYREILGALPDDIQVRRRYALVLLWAGQDEQSAAELRRTLPE